MRRNSDDDLRDLERKVASGDVTALPSFDRAYVRAHGLSNLAGRYASLLLLAYRATPLGETATILVPDGISGNPGAIELTAKHGSERHSRPQFSSSGGRTGAWVDQENSFVAIKARLLPGLADEFYHPRVPESSDTLHDGPPGAPVERIDPTQFEEAHRRLDEAMYNRNLVRDENDNLEWVIGWGDREFLLQAARAFMFVREAVAKIDARRIERRNAGLDLWKNVRKKLRNLASRVATGERRGRNMSHLYGEAVDLLRGVRPPASLVVSGDSETVPINAAGEGWSRWATERLAALLEETPFNDGGRARRLTVTQSPCSLWSSDNSNLGMSRLEVLPVGVSRSWQGANRETVSVGIAYPGSMDFRRLVAKAKDEPLDEWEVRYPPAGRFELAMHWGATHRTQSLANLIESVIRENFPEAVIERSTQRI